MNVNASGRKWARAALIIGMGLSVGGNFSHALLAESEITAWLRVWPALFLPIIAFVAIEVLIRIDWQRKASWQIARALIVAPLVSAGVSSFEHLRSLLLLMGERDFTAWWVPGAIDGLIIGATVVLVVTRSLPVLLVPAARESVTEEGVDAILSRWTASPPPPPALSPAEEEELRLWAEELDSPPAPVSPAPRVSSRASSPDALRQGMDAVEMLLEGGKPADVARETGAGESTVYKWRKTLNIILAQGADALVTEKVSAELIEYMRERAREIEAAAF